RRIGTNPVSIAIPAEGDPLLLDMSTSAIANGKLQEAAREGRPLPPGTALAERGEPTIDAQAALSGARTAFRRAKGHALSRAGAAWIRTATWSTSARLAASDSAAYGLRTRDEGGRDSRPALLRCRDASGYGIAVVVPGTTMDGGPCIPD